MKTRQRECVHEFTTKEQYSTKASKTRRTKGVSHPKGPELSEEKERNTRGDDHRRPNSGVTPSQNEVPMGFRSPFKLP